MTATSGSGAASEDPALAAPQGECHPKCATWLGEARGLLARAEALGDAPNVAVVFGQAGDAFARGWRGCALREPVAEDLRCEGAATTIADMMRAYDAAGRVDGQIVARLAALDPRWRRAAAGADTTARQLPELAAAAEQATAQAPKAPHAADALDAAVYGHLAANDVAGATRAAGQFRRLFGASQPDTTSLQATAIALAAGQSGNWSTALSALTAAGAPTRAKEARTKVLWHSVHGRALEAAGKADRAAADHDQVLAAWGAQGPPDVAAFAGHANPRPMLDRESVVEAIGDAYLYRGRRALARAGAAPVPRYTGPKTVVGVNDYVKGPFAEWVTERQQRLKDAELPLSLIPRIRPVAPPRPLVAGAYETGRAWTQFAEAFDRAEPPPHVAADPELQAEWRRSMREASGRVRESARAAFESCAKLAARFELAAEEQSCRQQLAAQP